ncbi:MAG TPA: C40 family peptidase [Anaerolineae bacterium]|nr:C40 family peptidase [Anaerolineae bacterium]
MSRQVMSWAMVGACWLVALSACGSAPGLVTPTVLPSPPTIASSPMPPPTIAPPQEEPMQQDVRDGDTAVVVDPVANLYSQPTVSADVVTQAILGTGVALWEARDGWYYVRLPDLYQGWIEARHLRLYDPQETPYASAGQVAQVRSLLAFLYREPDVTTHAPAMQVTLSTRLELVEVRNERWLRVALPDRSERWIQQGDVEIVDGAAAVPRGTAEDVIATARRFLGLPYLWGGSTPLGIDCSAYVQLAYHLHGVELLRDADIQYDQPGLAPVERDALQPGDLIFFGTASITHVGLYIGDGQFIHATTHVHPVVQISHLDEPHWTGLYYGARRP